MKKFLLLTTFLPLFLRAQEKEVFRNEQATIVESERKAAESMLSSGMLSVASGNFDVHHYRCEWQIDPAIRYIRGKVTTSFTMIQPGNTITFDLVNQLVVDSILYHGAKINFTRLANNGLQVTFPANIAQNAKDSVSVYYQGDPAGGGFGAFYQGAHSGVPVIWTLSEPYGAKDWWPCKDGLTDKADSIDVIITHPSIYTASSNGIVVSKQPIAGNTVTHFSHRYRIATYLVAIAVTNYVERTDTVRAGNKVYNYHSYAYPENAGSFFNSEILFSKEAFRTFSQLFGEYPFAKEKYGHTQFGWGGGMEHQTNSFMVNTSPNLSAHELAHQWFGNKVTCGSWQHIWLNEGFATYLTAIYLQYNFPTFYRSFLQSTLNSVVSQPGGSLFVPDTTNTNRIFDGRLSYNKGAYVVHMLRWVLGDSSFFRGMRRYLEDPALRYNFAKTADLQRNLQQESGKNLETFFQKWVYGEGYANYKANWYQAPGSPWVTVKLDQTTSHASVGFYEMPVELEFRKGTQTLRVVADHRHSGQVFSFNVGFQVDSLSIDPDIWILAATKTSTRSSVELLPPDDIQLHPNPSPANATLRLRNATGNKLYVRVFNAAGQLVFRRELGTAAGAQVELTIPFMRFAKGVYVVDIRNDKNLKVTKRIVH